MKLISRLASRIALAAAATSLGFAAATAADINLKFSDSLPLNDRNTNLSINPWIERVTERTGGKVEFSHFPNEQLGKGRDALAMTQSGITDIAYMVPAWISDKLPMVGVAELPGLYDDACTGGKAYWKLLQEGGLLYETHFKQQNVHPLFPMMQAPYTLFTRATEIKSLDDLKGLRIRATGSAQTPFVAELGAVPVGIPGPEVHESMSRGTLDALIFPVTGLFVFDVVPYVKYGYTQEVFGGAAPLVAMNRAKWEALPDDVKQVMNEVSLEIIDNFCNGLEAWKKEAVQQIQGMGVSVVEMPAEVSAELDKHRQAIQEKWAKDFDALGMGGTEMLNAFKAAVEEVRAGK